MTAEPQVETFADWLTQAMANRDDLKVRELELYSGVSRSNISEYRRGKALPSDATVLRLAEYFHVDHAWLLELVVGERIRERVRRGQKQETEPRRLVIDDNPEMVRDIATWIGYLLPLSPAQRREVLEIAREKNQRGDRQDGPAQ